MTLSLGSFLAAFVFGLGAALGWALMSGLISVLKGGRP
jgi:hypothetical protein